MHWTIIPLAIVMLLTVGCGDDAPPKASAEPAKASETAKPTAIPQEIPPVGDKLILSDADWQKRLSAEQYTVLRRKGTEPAFCGGYTAIKHNGPGTYSCAGCGVPLFTHDTKFESGTGWPSFFQPIAGRVDSEIDNAHGMIRTEVHCARCGGHLGHLFDDGPKPTGMRYCINAVSLSFTPAVAHKTAPPATK
jgi:peptide-methionine (R)-S-oxide reductase